MKIEITKPWRNHSPGDVVEVPDHTGAALIGQQHAIPATAKKKKAATPEPTPEPVTEES